MSEQLAHRFIDALKGLEREGNLDALVSLYREDAEIGNLLEPTPLRGPRGARSFWSMYRDTFRDVTSRFRYVVATDKGAALEWTSEGTTRHGQPFRYDGVTILQFTDSQIVRSWAYFDPSSLGLQLRGAEAAPVEPGA